MSVLIKGMEMPKHGGGVCLIVANFESCGSPVAMLVDRESILPKDFYDAIEIPTPHGRLIDADEIEKCVHEWYDVGEYVFADTIRNADTIIEAEVSE